MRSDPIKSVEEYQRFIRSYNNRAEFQFFALLNIMFETNLRISDCLALTWKRVRQRGELRDYCIVKEKKTGKYKRFFLTDNMRIILTRLYDQSRHRKINNYIFCNNKGKKLSYHTVYRRIKKRADKLKMKGNISCHTFRKSYAYALYQSTKDLSIVMTELNQSSIKSTLLYLGIEEEIREKHRREISKKYELLRE